MRVLGYIRVSQVRGRKGEAFVSPASQREVIERWAAANGADLVAVFEELDESGGRVDRPYLVRCVEAIESGEVDGMVVAKLDRFFRDQLGGHVTLKRIRDAKGFLAVPGDGIDTRNQVGKQMLGFLLAIGEGQLDRFREQFAEARARAVARGTHICPVPPVGYTRRVDEKGKVVSPLEPDPQVAAHVRRVFERRADGEPLAALARYHRG
jgi:site-specific DNA recombinase